MKTHKIEILNNKVIRITNLVFDIITLIKIDKITTIDFNSEVKRIWIFDGSIGEFFLDYDENTKEDFERDKKMLSELLIG